MIVLNVSDRYLDDHELWTSTDFAVHCFKLIVNNVQVTCKYSVSVKARHLIFDHNLGKCRPNFTVVSLADFHGNCLCDCYGDLHLSSTALVHCLMKLTCSKF